MSDHHSKKQVTVTSGPVYVPPINSFILYYPVPNNKVVVSLKNPTHKKLEARVNLGICSPCPPAAGPTPPDGSICNNVQKVKTMEQEINLGWHKVDPMSCLRLEKFFPDYDLGNSVIRVEAKGDFKVDCDSHNLIGGLLEISSLVGFFYGPMSTPLNLSPEIITSLQSLWIPYNGLAIGDASTFVSFGDYVFVKEHHEHKACSSSSSSSSSGSDSSDDY